MLLQTAHAAFVRGQQKQKSRIGEMKFYKYLLQNKKPAVAWQQVVSLIKFLSYAL